MASTSPKPFVFVLMPFSDDFDDVYKLGIKPSCEKAGAYAERVDEQIFRESILQRIYNQIAKADIVVADMTDRNPNVFYETGYAHALGKHVILLTKNGDDIPFDLKHYPHIIYGKKISDLIPELERRIRWAIENPEGSKLSLEPPVQFFVAGKSLSNSPTIEFPISISDAYDFGIQFDIHNPLKSSIQVATFRVALITSKRIPDVRFRGNRVSCIKSPDGKNIHLLEIVKEILPGAWDSFFVDFSGYPAFTLGDEEIISLRIFTQAGPFDFPFIVNANEKIQTLNPKG